MSGIKVWRNAITKEQRAEFLKEIADCLDSGVAYDNNLLTEIPFGGRLAEPGRLGRKRTTLLCGHTSAHTNPSMCPLHPKCTAVWTPFSCSPGIWPT